MKEFINNKLTILVNDPNQEKAISQTFPNVVETYDETKAQQFALGLLPKKCLLQHYGLYTFL